MTSKNILITGPSGFIGKNLVNFLEKETTNKLHKFRHNDDLNELEQYIKDCDIVIHLAGVNRPPKEDDFDLANRGFTQTLIDLLEKNKKRSPIIFSSSTQVNDHNLYGQSKLLAENLILDYGMNNQTNVYILRLPGVFGRWCKPNYNSVVATFSHNIANNLPIKIHDPKKEITLLYVQDLITNIDTMIKYIPAIDNPISLRPIHKITLDKLAKVFKTFEEKNIRGEKYLPKDDFDEALYETFLSYKE